MAARPAFKDYYATLGVDRKASREAIKRAYRKLARKFHPDVSQEPDAESRFKEVAEAHEALIDGERRAAYDDLTRRHAAGEDFEPDPGDAGSYEFSGRGAGRARPEADFSAFFESLFGRADAGPGGRQGAMPGADHHARIEVDLLDAYLGARHAFSLRRPGLDAAGQPVIHERQVEVLVPKGVRAGQHLRLAGMGDPGPDGKLGGDLYLEVGFRPHPRYRLDGADVWFDLPVAPWEAALGAAVDVATPGGLLQLVVPAGSGAGRKLRLKGRGLPGKVAGDLYALLQLVLPPADSAPVRAAYGALAQACADFDPRRALEA
jgi:curved DNA-binding protein